LRSASPAAAKPEVVDNAISLILEGFGGRTASPDKARAYGIALEGLPAESIARGVRAILRGEVADVDPAFPPTAAQLAKACRGPTFISPGFALPPPETDDWPEPSNEQKARVDALISEAILGMRNASLSSRQQEIQQREDAARKSAERLRRVAAEMAARQTDRFDEPPV
jgi:hypothetical protein